MQDELRTLQIHFYCAVQLANINVVYMPRQCIIHYMLHNLPGRKIRLTNLWFSRSPSYIFLKIAVVLATFCPPNTKANSSNTLYTTLISSAVLCVSSFRAPGWKQNHLIFAIYYLLILLICFKISSADSLVSENSSNVFVVKSFW